MGEIERKNRAQRQEIETLEGLIAPVGIRNGLQCKNWVVDQQKVMSLLSRIPESYGGAQANFAARDGYCVPAFATQIKRFQQLNGLPADGVVDPGGATFKLLRKLAAGGNLPDPHGPNRHAQEYIDYLWELVTVGKRALHHPGLPGRVRSPLALHLNALETNLKLAGLKPTVIRGATMVEQLVLLGILALALGTYALMSNPVYRDAFVKYVRGLGKSAVEIAQFLLENEVMVIRLVTDYWLFVMMNAANTVLALAAEVEKLANQQKCDEEFRRYTLAKSSVLEKIRNSRLPGSRINPDVLSSAFIEFMASVYSLLDCSGHLNKLRGIVALLNGGTVGVIKFVVQTILGKKLVFPFPIPDWVP